MCGPISPMMAAGIGGGAAGFNILQQGMQASAANRLGRRQYTQNRDEAIRAMVQQYTGTQRRVIEEREAAAQGLQQMLREAQEAVGTVRASTTNVEGASVEALVRDYERQETIRIGVAETNLRNFEVRAQEELEAIRSQAQSRINAGIPTPVQTPNLLGAAIQIGTQAFGSYLQAGGGQLQGSGDKE